MQTTCHLHVPGILISRQTKAKSLKTSYAQDASTALNWADERHRVLIAENLRTNADVLAAEILATPSADDRAAMYRDLARVYTRLAACDMDRARVAERNIGHDMQRESICRITLEKMADMTEEPAVDDRGARPYLEMAQAFARLIQEERLADFFSTGPYSGLGRLALTVAELDIDKALKGRAALPELVRMARMIPLDQGVDEEKIESQIFRDGLRLFRRHQGLEKYPHEK